MLEGLERDKFAAAIGSVFMLTAAEGVTAELELSEVTEVREGRGQRGFSILFLAPPNCAIQQGLYDLQHSSLGEMLLFLVPVGRRQDRLKLEAVFNELIDD